MGKTRDDEEGKVNALEGQAKAVAAATDMSKLVLDLAIFELLNSTRVYKRY